MPFTLAQLRRGETGVAAVSLEATGGGEVGPLANVSLGSNAPGVVEVTAYDDVALTADVEAVASGSTTLFVSADDAFADPILKTTPVTVLDASHIRIAPNGPASDVAIETTEDGWIVRPTSTAFFGLIPVRAIPEDAREDTLGLVDYGSEATSIAWSTEPSNGTILFNDGVNPSSATFTGSLDVALELNAYGSTVVVVTAQNGSGQPIEGRLNIDVTGAVATATWTYTRD